MKSPRWHSLDGPFYPVAELFFFLWFASNAMFKIVSLAAVFWMSRNACDWVTIQKCVERWLLNEEWPLFRDTFHTNLDKIDGKFVPRLSPKSRMGKWRVLAFARLHPWFGGMGVCCSILFCPRLKFTETFAILEISKARVPKVSRVALCGTSFTYFV